MQESQWLAFRLGKRVTGPENRKSEIKDIQCSSVAHEGFQGREVLGQCRGKQTTHEHQQEHADFYK